MNDQKRRTYQLLKDTLHLVAPIEPISVADWADEHRILSAEASAEPGPWRTSRAPYQREPMNAIADRSVEKVVLMWASQLGKTDIQLNAIGYFTGHDPSPIMVVHPDLQVARDFSNDRLAPMYRDSPQLSKLVVKDKSRDSRNTILYKTFPGGRINIAGTNSPASLASKPIRVVVGDEIDRFALSAGKEGDPIALVTARTKTFYNKNSFGCLLLQSKESLTSRRCTRTARRRNGVFPAHLAMNCSLSNGNRSNSNTMKIFGNVRRFGISVNRAGPFMKNGSGRRIMSSVGAGLHKRNTPRPEDFT